ncbi:MAG: hypothetical protein A4E63_00152 [Syntrophorhabdus sp. PtaU1.Bin050]|nr:MAG: hypothetical protein A4E63_00152 [Syntrophorhabdus sp. PtaU1.Bin050]
MSNEFHWTCPFCNRDTVITAERIHNDHTDLTIPNAEGPRRLTSHFIVCPNPKCKKTTLSVALFVRQTDQVGRPSAGKLVQQWSLIPSSRAVAFPDYIPQPVIDDYDEACLIADLSPKASATLSRRCLQSIIRDFWKVKPGRLVDEIEQIKDRTDPITCEAIDSVRKVGNIGAHMEKDIDLIVDVEPHEAALLIGLIETLIRDWYIAREERKTRLVEIKRMADRKDEAKKATAKTP